MKLLDKADRHGFCESQPTHDITANAPDHFDFCAFRRFLPWRSALAELSAPSAESTRRPSPRSLFRLSPDVHGVSGL